MIILIDAYNVLKYIYSGEFISEVTRQNFLKMLNNYARMKHHHLIAVFDGGATEYPLKEKSGLVEIIYSGNKYSADDILKKLINEFLGHEVMLVSSDRTLGVYANKYTIPALDSDEFYKLLIQKPDMSEQKSGQIMKRKGHKSSGEVDALMHQLAKLIDKDEEISEKRMPSSHTLSKKEKKLLKIVKKL